MSGHVYDAATSADAKAWEAYGIARENRGAHDQLTRTVSELYNELRQLQYKVEKLELRKRTP